MLTLGFQSVGTNCTEGAVTDISFGFRAPGRLVGALSDWHQHGVSIQISINLGKTSIRISFIKTKKRSKSCCDSESWRECSHIYLLSLLRFWTYFIEPV